MADDKLTKLADPASAIASYLDDLLHTATDTAQKEEVTVVEASPEPQPELQPKPEPEPVVRKPAPKVEVNQPEPEPEPVSPPSRLEWSEQPFECLIFTVAGLQLAVPLILLGAIHRIEESIKPIPGSPRWY
ncbi:MAG: chemotaxis protein CheW, partial [Marinobacter sp.]|nr:chemotaxis protein CheW [Marinobacter sp.]